MWEIMSSEAAPMRRPARAVLAGVAVIVLVGVMSLIELGVLTLLAIASAAMNHGGAS
jgi:hypothetical protein